MGKELCCLCTSLQLPCVFQKGETVPGRFDELISHPSPPARKHLESCSMTFPPAQLAGSWLGTTVSIPHCLWPFGLSLVSCLGTDVRQEQSHLDPQLHLIFAFLLLFVCLCLDPKFPSLFRTERGRLSLPPGEHGHSPACAEQQWTGDTAATPRQEIQLVNPFLSSLILMGH